MKTRKEMTLHQGDVFTPNHSFLVDERKRRISFKKWMSLVVTALSYQAGVLAII